MQNRTSYCRNISRWFRFLAIISLVVVLSGCAIDKQLIEPQDPYENINRKVFAFNMTLDRACFKPIAKVYDRVLPDRVKKSVYNFFGNLGNVPNVANDLLQANFHQAAADGCRFFFNSTIGVAGLFDIASRMGLPPNYQDFGLTLAKWGTKNTPYLVLPFFGPSTVRDTVGLPINYEFLSVWPYIEPVESRYALAAVSWISTRERLLAGDKVLEQAFDPYIFVRNAYLQRRAVMIDKNAHLEVAPDKSSVRSDAMAKNQATAGKTQGEKQGAVGLGHNKK
jgi:phospholipid-binding lipoprotein MlaA